MQTTYEPAFHACIREGGARSVLCSYNAINGVPSCGNAALLTGRLRDAWGFDGFIVSDCYAIKGITFPGRWARRATRGSPAAQARARGCAERQPSVARSVLADRTRNGTCLTRALHRARRLGAPCHGVRRRATVAAGRLRPALWQLRACGARQL